jgi:hypothetical protein
MRFPAAAARSSAVDVIDGRSLVWVDAARWVKERVYVINERIIFHGELPGMFAQARGY